ncbi:uncharacterized protein [Ptychodera flava]|uniref:uncharacterized protein n=1 Tax=Ptychodera flava TaxID=63121 RepID=UPI003969C690
MADEGVVTETVKGSDVWGTSVLSDWGLRAQTSSPEIQHHSGQPRAVAEDINLETTPQILTTTGTKLCGDQYSVIGTLNGVQTTMFVDSGSQITIARKDLPVLRDLPLSPVTIRPEAVNGTAVQFMGQVQVNIAVQGCSLGPVWIYVMSPEFMRNEFLLGTDIMEKLGKMEVDFINKTVRFKQQTQKTCTTFLSDSQKTIAPQCCRVTLLQTTVIPPRHEKVCRVQVPAFPGQEGVIEGNEQLFESKKVACGASLNLVNDNQTTYVRLCNPHPNKVKLYRGSSIGNFDSSIGIPIQIGQVQERKDKEISRKEDSTVQETIAAMVDGSQIDQARKGDLHNMLNRFTDTFSLNGEMGQTNIIKHRIHTGDAYPLRSRARRTGFHEREVVDTILTTCWKRT